jgi:hypothetical protein
VLRAQKQPLAPDDLVVFHASRLPLSRVLPAALPDMAALTVLPADTP